MNAENYEQALRSTIIHISFDAHKTISCPIGDFFGTGEMKKFMLTVNLSHRISEQARKNITDMPGAGLKHLPGILLSLDQMAVEILIRVIPVMSDFVPSMRYPLKNYLNSIWRCGTGQKRL